MLTEISKQASVSDEAIDAFYSANPDNCNAPELIHARHILIKVEAEADPATRDAVRQRIDAITRSVISRASPNGPTLCGSPTSFSARRTPTSPRTWM